MEMKEVGVELDGTVEWHFPGKSGAEHATLCGLDSNDPFIGQTGFVDAPRGTKINCQQCGTI